MRILRFGCAGFASFALLLAAMPATCAEGLYVSREQDIVGLRLGQRVLVDDGTCGAGEIKEVLGSRMTPTGVLATKKCIQRLGPKKR